MPPSIGRMVRLVLPVAAGLLAVHGSCGPAPGSAPAQIAGARALMARVAASRGIAELPPLMTNESAGALGALFGSVLYMVSGFAESMSGMAQGMAAGMGASGGQAREARARLQNDPDMVRLRALKAQTTSLFRRYGIDLTAPTASPASGARVKAQGRRFLGDVITLFDRLPDRPGAPASSMRLRTVKLPIQMDRLQYRVLGAGRVGITGAAAKGQPLALEARLEDGAWRMHIADFSRLAAAGPSGAPQAAPRAGVTTRPGQVPGWSQGGIARPPRR